MSPPPDLNGRVVWEDTPRYGGYVDVRIDGMSPGPAADEAMRWEAIRKDRSRATRADNALIREIARHHPDESEAVYEIATAWRMAAGLVYDSGTNPECPAVWYVDPAWLSWNAGTVPRLAQGIHDERAFDRLPVLADALEDAGCTDAAILDHCRSGGRHDCGCWVVDLLLGRGSRAVPTAEEERRRRGARQRR